MNNDAHARSSLPQMLIHPVTVFDERLGCMSSVVAWVGHYRRSGSLCILDGGVLRHMPFNLSHQISSESWAILCELLDSSGPRGFGINTSNADLRK